jgi:hypothetical protein
VFESLCSGVTLRRTAKNLRVTYRTVCRKFRWLSERASAFHGLQKFKVRELQFDEMESIEHTKLKPLTIVLAVSESYQILGMKVGSIPAKGHLAGISHRKYGLRRDESSTKIRDLLSEVKSQLLCYPNVIKSDFKPSYKNIVQQEYPDTCYVQHLAKQNKEKRREMKYQAKEKQVYDPLFAVNQRCAMLRADIKRLTRRSWCTTKIPENLEKHLMLYIAHNNKYVFC